MDNFDQADTNIMNFSDEDDLRLFESRHEPELARKILRVKRNDPEVTSLIIATSDDLNERAWRRLGHILGQNTYLEELRIWNCNLHVAGLCAGLRNNQCIQKLNFYGINLRETVKMSSLALFLSRNPSLRVITLTKCNIGSTGINILSSALLERSNDTLEWLDLSNNCVGDDLTNLVLSLSRSKQMRWLFLCGNGIGRSGCASLARLLGNQGSNLEYLHLYDNSIDNESAIILADSLARNTKLKTLCLYTNNAINPPGWSAIVKLVCNNSSINGIMESNHTLNFVGFSVDRITSVNIDANLLRVSLKMNRTRNKTLVARRKILWIHARGKLNLGDSSITTGIMPRILAWIGKNPSSMHRILAWIRNDSNEWNISFGQYCVPTFPKARIDTIELDSIYRIVRSRPELCKTNDLELLSGNRLRDAIKPINARLWAIIYLVLLLLVVSTVGIGIVWSHL